MDYMAILVTLLIGILAFSIQELISQFVLKPLVQFNQIRGKTIELLVNHSRHFTDPRTAHSIMKVRYEDSNVERLCVEYDRAAMEIRGAASQMYGFIPLRYSPLSLFKVPSKYTLADIARKLILISNYQVALNSEEAIIQSAQYIKKVLGLDLVELRTAAQETKDF